LSEIFSALVHHKPCYLIPFQEVLMNLAHSQNIAFCHRHFRPCRSGT